MRQDNNLLLSAEENFEQEGNIISEPLFGVIGEVINLDNKTAITFDFNE